MQVTTTPAEVAQVAVGAVNEAKKSTGNFGIKQIGNLTPDWAQWMFRIFFYLIAFANLYIGFDADVTPEFAKQFMKWSSIAVIAVHGFSKLWGIDTKKIQQEAVDAFAQAQQL